MYRKLYMYICGQFLVLSLTEHRHLTSAIDYLACFSKAFNLLNFTESNKPPESSSCEFDHATSVTSWVCAKSSTEITRLDMCLFQRFLNQDTRLASLSERKKNLFPFITHTIFKYLFKSMRKFHLHKYILFTTTSNNGR